MADPVHFNDNIGKFFKGAVVQTRGDVCWRLIGHVEGFRMNESGEVSPIGVLVIVAFCNGETHTVHISSLYPL